MVMILLSLGILQEAGTCTSILCTHFTTRLQANCRSKLSNELFLSTQPYAPFYFITINCIIAVVTLNIILIIIIIIFQTIIIIIIIIIIIMIIIILIITVLLPTMREQSNAVFRVLCFAVSLWKTLQEWPWPKVPLYTL